MVSTDRDAFQLASDKVCIMMTPRGVTDVVVYTPDRIRQRYGIGPEQIPDFIGLKGDTSDNINGVPGIGEKTAAELLIQFGILEGIYEHLDEVSGDKRRESLRHQRDDAAQSKQLATIDRDRAADVDFNELVAEPPDRSGMKELFRKLEFRALLGRIDELEEALPAAPRRAVEQRRRGLARGRPGRAGGAAARAGALGRGGRAVVGRRASRDVLVVDVAEPAGWWRRWTAAACSPTACTCPACCPRVTPQIAAYLSTRPLRLRDRRPRARSRARAAHQADAGDRRADARRRDHSSPARGAGRARGGAARWARSTADIELPLMPVLADMERSRRADRQLPAGRDRRQAARPGRRAGGSSAYELAGGPFTIGSPKQLGEVLFERLGLPTDRKGKTGYSTDARVLAKLRDLHPIVDVIEAWREQSKLLNTYLSRCPAGRPRTAGCTPPSARPRPPPAGCRRSARTCRTSPIRTPLGREIRGAFVAERRLRMLSADYSQVELRILAHLSGEPALRMPSRAARTSTGRPPPRCSGKPAEELTATERNRAKAVNFGIIYGISAFGLSEQLGISREEAQSLHRRLPGALPGGQRVHRARVIEQAKEDGYVDHAVRAAAADPRAARRPTTRPAAWASGWP